MNDSEKERASPLCPICGGSLDRKGKCKTCGQFPSLEDYGFRLVNRNGENIMEKLDSGERILSFGTPEFLWDIPDIAEAAHAPVQVVKRSLGGFMYDNSELMQECREAEAEWEEELNEKQAAQKHHRTQQKGAGHDRLSGQ